MNNAIETCDAIADSYFKEFSEPSDHINDFVSVLKPGSHILDLGCGPGVDSAYLCEKGFHVHGIDASANMLSIAKKNAPDARFEIGDMRTFDYGLEKYDGIIASYSLIHIHKEDVPAVFDKLSKALKPSGYLFIGLQMGQLEEVELIEPLNPDLKIFVNVFSKSETHNLLNSHGFEILKEHERASENAEEFDFIKYCVLARKGK